MVYAAPRGPSTMPVPDRSAQTLGVMTHRFLVPSLRKLHCTIRALAAVLAFTLGLPATSQAKPREPEHLPTDAPREVLGTWQLVEPPLPCTRSIELIKEQYYMVARCSDNASADGSRGLRIERLGPNIFEGLAGQHYEVRRDGWLYMLDGRHVSLKAKPISSSSQR